MSYESALLEESKDMIHKQEEIIKQQEDSNKRLREIIRLQDELITNNEQIISIQNRQFISASEHIKLLSSALDNMRR